MGRRMILKLKQIRVLAGNCNEGQDIKRVDCNKNSWREVKRSLNGWSWWRSTALQLKK